MNLFFVTLSAGFLLTSSFLSAGHECKCQKCECTKESHCGCKAPKKHCSSHDCKCGEDCECGDDCHCAHSNDCKK